MSDKSKPFEPLTEPRVKPLAPDDLKDKGVTTSALFHAAYTWGQGLNFQNNLIKTMAHCPRLAQTEIDYANSFIFDEESFLNGVQQAGFIDRYLKEIIITCVALENKAYYSVTHHSFISYITFKNGREEEYVPKFIDLHLPLNEFEKKYGDTHNPYDEIEYELIRYTKKICHAPHSITDNEVQKIRGLLEAYNRKNVKEPWGGQGVNDMLRLIDSQLVEITWIAAHFCLLGRWFIALGVQDEGENDVINFKDLYINNVPTEIITRNNELLSKAYKR